MKQGKSLAINVVPIFFLLAGATAAFADLQNVTVGTDIQIRGQYWRNTFNARVLPAGVGPQIRWPGSFMPARPIGDASGGQNVMSYYDWDSRHGDYRLVEQRTRLNLNADFTDRVSAFVEVDSYDVWGTDFRSNYITGADVPGGTADDVGIYQAYIEANEMWGLPLQLRVGRQELELGGGWLLGNNSRLPEFPGLSFDGIRLEYRGESFTFGAFWTKLFERGPIEEDGDTDLAGIYSTCTAVENVVFEAYWLWLRDAQSLNDTNSDWFSETLENILGIDDYDVTNLNTVALRASGRFDAFDFDASAAYQFGDAGQVGFLFRPFTYGVDDAEYDQWAGDAELGYTFDMACSPRVYLGGAYFGGEDNRGVGFAKWLSPFGDSGNASVSFNRLFSNKVYSYFIDEMGQLSNVWTARAGVSLKPAENIEVGLNAAYFESLEAFRVPVYLTLGRYRVPVVPDWSFLTAKNDTDLGWEIDLWATYHYSDDLKFKAGWSHLFVGDGLSEGNYNDFNGLQFNGGTASDDADYFYAETTLSF